MPDSSRANEIIRQALAEGRLAFPEPSYLVTFAPLDKDGILFAAQEIFVLPNVDGSVTSFLETLRALGWGFQDDG